MKIIPAIYLSGGNAVTYYKGESEQSEILSRHPVDAALEFKRQGATTIHLVDLDAVVQMNLIEEIIQKSGLRVQYAGDLVSLDVVRALLQAGVSAVSLDQNSEHLVAPSLTEFGSEKIIFTIKSQRNIVKGKEGLEVFHYGTDVVNLGIKTIISHDMKAEGTLHPNFDEVERLIMAVGGRAEIFAFGGVGNYKDIEILQKTGAAGAIISRAFFERRLSLEICMRRFGAL